MARVTAASDLSGGVSRWLLRKLFGMLLTMLAVSFLVFAVLELNVDVLVGQGSVDENAGAVIESRQAERAVQDCLSSRGLV